LLNYFYFVPAVYFIHAVRVYVVYIYIYIAADVRVCLCSTYGR